MRKKILNGLLVVVLAVGTCSSSLQAQESAATANMPEREKAFIDMLIDVRTRYTANHAVSAAQDSRMGLQIRMMSFMRESQIAQDWRGIVKSGGITSDGNARLTIEIADGITVGTWTTDTEDRGRGTLFKPGSPLFDASKTLKIGDPVVFSGTIVNSILASDDEMLMRPQFIVRFTALRPGA
jgi:hypothetical protein